MSAALALSQVRQCQRFDLISSCDCLIYFGDFERITLKTAVGRFTYDEYSCIFIGMMRDLKLSASHPAGEQSPVEDKGAPPGVNVDSFTGPVRVEWDAGSALTPLGQLPFFVDYLKTAGLFDAFIADCPLHYTSANAPKNRDVFGTAMLSICPGTNDTRISRPCAGMLFCQNFLA